MQETVIKQVMGSRPIPTPRLFTFLMFSVLCSPLVFSAPVGDGAGAARRPLDLPSGGTTHSEEEEEEAPDLIHFYGHDHEGDNFVWVLDISGSMGDETGGELIDQLKMEFSQAVTSLSRTSSFSALAFDNNLYPFDMVSRMAVPSRKNAAISWCNGLIAEGATCLTVATITGLEISRTRQTDSTRLIIVGDGVPYCYGEVDLEQSISDIQNANWEQIPIDAVYVGDQELGLQYFQMLTESCNGRLTICQ